MKNRNNDIYSEFLTIEPFDILRLDKFYNDNKIYFSEKQISDKEKQEKHLIMISEIGKAYSFSAKHIEAIQVLQTAESIYKSIGADNKSDATYNSVIFCLANSNLALKNYYISLNYFKSYMKTDKENNDIELLIQLCKDKIKDQILLLIGAFGFFFLSIKYTIKWFSPENYTQFIQRTGLLGGLLLLTYGIMKSIPKRKNNC
jgi:hypothetical protein